MPDTPSVEWISVAEAAERTGWTERWITMMVKRQLIRAKPFGRRSLAVAWDDIEAYRATHKTRGGWRKQRADDAGHDDDSPQNAQRDVPAPEQRGSDHHTSR